jgi:DNA-binding IclR family transcriptional regulator
MYINDQLTILRAIYRRSHAQHQNNASLEEVADDLGLPRGTVMYKACRPLQSMGLLRLFGAFVQLTSTGRDLVENA